MKRLTTTLSIACLTVMVAFVVSSCSDRINPAPPISTDGYPTMSLTTPQTKTVTEGNTINYTLKADKPLEHNTPFTLYSPEGSASSADYSAASVTYPQFVVDTSIVVPVTATVDNIPEKDETLSYEIGINPLTNIRLRKTLNPNSDVPAKQSITIKNHNDPSGLTVAYQWPNTDNDLDMLTFVDVGNDGTIDGIVGQSLTGDDPEIIIIPNQGSPDGTYYYGLNPFSVAGDTTDYKFRVGYPDQKVEIYPGNFDLASDSTKVRAISAKIGGTPTPFYLLFSVKKTGSTYSEATLLDSGGSSSSSARVNIEGIQLKLDNFKGSKNR